MARSYRVVEVLDPALPGGGVRVNVAVFNPKAKVPDYPKDDRGKYLTFQGPDGDVYPPDDPTCEPSPFGLPEGATFVQVDVLPGAVDEDGKKLTEAEQIERAVKAEIGEKPKAKKLVGMEGEL